MITYKNRTHFVKRYDDGKREMTISEIRSAFSDNYFARRLSSIEEGIKSLISIKNARQKSETLNAIINGQTNDLEITDGKMLNEGKTNYFHSIIGDKAFFRVSITPKTIHRNLLDVDKEDIISLLNNPPDQRQSGWNMKIFSTNAQRFSEGSMRADNDNKLILLQNGHMEFSIPLSYSFSWTQPDEERLKHPLLHPYPVVEYPLSFLRLYKKIKELTSIGTSFYFSMQYFNINGFILRPYAPNTFEYSAKVKPYNDNNFISSINEISNDFQPDKVCFDILKELYATFGYAADNIPFYLKEQEKFNL